MKRYIRLGIDIGGTFTDLFAYNEVTGEIIVSKVPSTPPDFVDGVIDVIKDAKIDLKVVYEFIGHGSTIADNALIERKIPRIALLTTEGFRDIIFLGRLHREKLYDLQWDKPSQFRPIVKRRDIIEIKERTGPNGEIIIPLDKEQVRRVANKIVPGYDAYTIFYINSYTNPTHEMETKRILEEVAREKGIETVYISASYEILRTIRELPRLSTTLINAILMPIIAGYLTKLKQSLKDEGFDGDIILFQSNGGVMRSDLAAQKPVYVATSGPAAGVVASRYLAQFYNLEKVLSFDMGGTTAKTSTIINQEYLITTEFQFEWDIPIAIPMIEMSEVGTGGGSIAWIDKGGMLRVGPISAGSIPGPACYNRGGTEPTIVDANVVLHRLNPRATLGRRIKIDKEKAIEAIREKVGDVLGLDLIEAAMGILKIANTNMAEACRDVTLRKGYDSREFTLVAFGGAGPMHACDLARELGIRKIIIPWFPGVFSALGMCISDLMHDRVMSILKPLDEIDLAKLNDIVVSMESEVKKELVEEGVKEDNIRIIRYGRMRYIGEAIGKELIVQMPSGRINVEDLNYCREHFEKVHNEMYGFMVPGEPVVLTDIIIRGIGLTKKIEFKKYPLAEEVPTNSIIEEREVYFEEIGHFEPVKIYRREKLKHGNLIDGPAIIEEETTTTVLKPDCQAYIDEYKNIIIKIGG